MRYAIRSLLKSPGFTAATVLALALGIGATTAIFSVVYAVVLRPLPYGDPDRLVRVAIGRPQDETYGFSAGDFRDLKRDARALAAMTGYREDVFDMTSAAGEPERLRGVHVTSAFFDVFGVQPVRGRTFHASDGVEIRRTAVISHGLWVRRFASDPTVIGRAILLNGQQYTITAVMPPAFTWPAGEDVWVSSDTEVPPSPIALSGDPLTNREVGYFEVVARLKQDVTLERAQAEATAISRRLAGQYPSTNADRMVRFVPLHEEVVGDVRRALLVLLGAVGLVLLIACANVASLLLARGVARQREIALRAALGASRSRIVRQLLTESLLLGGIGGAAGLLLAFGGVRALVALAPTNIPRLGEIGLDSRVVLFTAGVSILTGIVFGLVPSLQASNPDLVEALKEGARSAGGARRALMRNALVVGEVALAVILLVGAGLMLNSFVRLQAVDPGFQADQVVAVGLALPQTRYSTAEAQAAFYRSIVERLRGIPQTKDAAASFPLPMSGGGGTAGFRVENRPLPPQGERPVAALGSVTPGYFRTMGIPVLKGRDFAWTDAKAAPPVMIVNSALARRFFPNEDPVGKRVRFGGEKGTLVTIVAVVGDVRLASLAAVAEPTLYLPYEQFTLPFMSVVVRTRGDVAAVQSAVRSEVRALDRDLPIDEVTRLNGVVARSAGQPRFRAVLLSGFAAVALLLAALGVYGIVSHAVTQRVREIGIRLALGATPGQVVRLLLRNGLTLTGIGVMAGIAGALALTTVIENLLFGVEPTDQATFALVVAALLLVALLAAYIPARRALRVDPMVTLRME